MDCRLYLDAAKLEKEVAKEAKSSNATEKKSMPDCTSSTKLHVPQMEGKMASADTAPRVPFAREGDWYCDNCGAHVFRYRVACFQCGAGKAKAKGGHWLFLGLGWGSSYALDDVRKLLRPFGMVDDCFILKDKETGQSRKRGQALACFRHDRDCEAAIAGLHHRLTLPGASEPLVVCRATSKDLKTTKDIRMPSANDGDTDKLPQVVSRDHLHSHLDGIRATERTSDPAAKRARLGIGRSSRSHSRSRSVNRHDNDKSDIQARNKKSDSPRAPRKRKSPSRDKAVYASTPRRSRSRECHSNARTQRQAERSHRGLDSAQWQRERSRSRSRGGQHPKARNECGRSPSRGSLKRRSRSQSRSDSSAQGKNGCNHSCDNDGENERPGVYIGVMRTRIQTTYIYLHVHSYKSILTCAYKNRLATYSPEDLEEELACSRGCARDAAQAPQRRRRCQGTGC